MKRLSLLVILLFALTAVACKKNIETVSYRGTQQGITQEQMRNAIIKGCAHREWKTVDIDQNTIEAVINVRGKHRVVVTIPYTSDSYSIRYKESTGMKYTNKNGEQKIHSSYNKWIHNLDRSIQTELEMSKVK